ncbi:hypothetical protein F5Y09DRAFT_340027 [Xylaria sp. FL1042]|nr:hypothetical protein F5Y09DRAFT_340027 [Xylaria sp. FL1042]
MSLPTNITSLPLSSTTPLTEAVLTTRQKKNRARNRKRQAMALDIGFNAQTGDKTPATPVQQVDFHSALGITEPDFHTKKQETIEQQMAEERMIDKELPVVKKMRLEVLEMKTEELQGYVNQIQDAVTIGMYQLRDLKKQIAAATADIKSIDK